MKLTFKLKKINLKKITTKKLILWKNIQKMS